MQTRQFSISKCTSFYEFTSFQLSVLTEKTIVCTSVRGCLKSIQGCLDSTKMKKIIKFIHSVYAPTFRWNFVVCILIGFMVTLLIPFKSNSYPTQNSHLIELGSKLSDYLDNKAKDIQLAQIQVNLRNSRCAQIFLITLERYMDPYQVNAQWSSGGRTYSFDWTPNRGSKPSQESITLNTSSIHSALDSSANLKENSAKLVAQTDEESRAKTALERAVSSENAQLINYRVLGRSRQTRKPCDWQYGLIQYGQ